MARDYGIGVVSVKRSTHFGMAASYALPAVEAGMMAMVFSNASPAMPPWGGTRHAARHQPVLHGGARRQAPADHSRHVAGGRSARQDPPRRAPRRDDPARLCARRGRPPTTDPKAALDGGVVLPIGEHKGSGISMFMDIFGGVISGANFGGEVGDQYKALDRAQDVGHFFLAMKPNLFVTEDEYRARIDTLIERVRAVPRAEGCAEILMPGEPEDRSKRSAASAASPTRRAKSRALQDRGETGGRAAGCRSRTDRSR